MIEINTDEEMNEINSLIDGMLKGKNIQIHNLVTGEIVDAALDDDDFQKKTHKIIREKRGVFLFKKKCGNPGRCKVGEWHDALVIAKGEIYISLDTAQAYFNEKLLVSLHNTLFMDLGDLGDKDE